jgi:hypothetical protein
MTATVISKGRVITASDDYTADVHMENIVGPTITCDTVASGTKAAAFGGTATVVDFALQTPQDSPLEAIARPAQRRAEGEHRLQPALHRHPRGQAGAGRCSPSAAP